MKGFTSTVFLRYGRITGVASLAIPAGTYTGGEIHLHFERIDGAWKLQADPKGHAYRQVFEAVGAAPPETEAEMLADIEQIAQQVDIPGKLEEVFELMSAMGASTLSD